MGTSSSAGCGQAHDGSSHSCKKTLFRDNITPKTKDT